MPQINCVPLQKVIRCFLPKITRITKPRNVFETKVMIIGFATFGKWFLKRLAGYLYRNTVFNHISANYKFTWNFRTQFVCLLSLPVHSCKQRTTSFMHSAIGHGSAISFCTHHKGKSNLVCHPIEVKGTKTTKAQPISTLRSSTTLYRPPGTDLLPEILVHINSYWKQLNF